MFLFLIAALVEGSVAIALMLLAGGSAFENVLQFVQSLFP